MLSERHCIPFSLEAMIPMDIKANVCECTMSHGIPDLKELLEWSLEDW
jgi:hypothetical protein